LTKQNYSIFVFQFDPKTIPAVGTTRRKGLGTLSEGCIISRGAELEDTASPDNFIGYADERVYRQLALWRSGA